ncbi:MAG: hypothetical protein H7Y17_11560 [Chlorobia bacterium]|nr:hypothetical protein [Fimbriimonadaceae bacterium]
MRNATDPQPPLQPDLAMPIDTEQAVVEVPPDLREDFGRENKNIPDLAIDPEFYPADILDEDPEFGSPEGVENSIVELNPMESIADIRDSESTG